ncbi:MAG: hypothetical protein ACREM1_02740 [Longimicrobiales bacterium]
MKARRLTSLCVVVVLTHACAGVAVEAQSPPFDGQAGVSFESYSFGSSNATGVEGITLFAVPLTVRARLSEHFEARASSFYARAALSRNDGSKSTLAGLTDTEVRLTYAVPGDRLRISAIALAPTGRTELTSEEMDVAGVIAADVLPFAITDWGSGGGTGASAAAALPLDEASVFGVSASYLVALEFEPVAATGFAYRPGNQVHVRAAIDRTFGLAGKASLQLTWQHFAADVSAGSNIYQAGDRLQALASYAFAAGTRAGGIVYAGYLRRGEGRYTEIVELTPAQDLIYGGTAFRIPAGGVVLTPSLDARLIGRDNGTDEGYSITIGSGIELPLSSALLVPTARARFGRLAVRPDAESGFIGLDVGVAVATRTPR